MQFANGTHLSLEMTRVGYFDNLELIICTDDPGSIPHFHVRDRGTRGEEFNCCIKITEPSYFLHTGKADKLNSKQKKNLVAFLKEDSNFGSIKLRNWDKVIMYWNDNNSDIILPVDTPMPDYTKLS